MYRGGNWLICGRYLISPEASATDLFAVGLWHGLKGSSAKVEHRLNDPQTCGRIAEVRLMMHFLTSTDMSKEV